MNLYVYIYIHAKKEVLSVSVCKGRSICGIANICIVTLYNGF